MDIKKILFVLDALGLGVASRTFRYGIMRDMIEKRYAHKTGYSESLLPGNIKQFNRLTSGINIEFENAKLEIIFLTTDLVRISWEPGKQPIPYAIYKKEWQEVNTTVEKSTMGYSLSNGKISISIGNNGEICFQNSSGNILRNEHAPILQGNTWRLVSDLRPEEHIYGLGERAASFNLRPGSYRGWNTDPEGSYSSGRDPLYICTPVYISLSNTGSQLVFFENSFPSTFIFGEKAEAIFEGGILRYYITFGSLQDILDRYTELTGRVALPPRWVFGYHQCRWGYHNEGEIREVVKGFKDNNLPISAIHLDLDYMDGFRVFTIDKDRFPDMEKLTNDLNNEGIKIVSIIDPGVKRDPQYKLYKDGLSKGVFCKLPNGKVLNRLVWPGWSVFPDFTNPITRQWWGEQYPYLLHEGIAGFWHDMNEPSAFAAWGEKTLPKPTLHDMDGRGGDHLEAHNLYGLLMNQAGYEALQKFSPERRPWIFSRAGWAGLQRYAWNWTGDTETSWKSLHQTIATILGLGLSGHSFSGPDIGGFSGSPSAELYLRWFQLATFLPFFRTHSAIGTQRREPWVYGEPTTSIIRKFLRLRYNLIPYLYTLAWEANQHGVPPVRPIFWVNPQDQNLWDIDDAFFLGEAMLIAPILEEGIQARQVILPNGNWYSFWDDRLYSGSSQIEVEISKEIIPVYIKAGSIIPMEENQRIYLHVYPDISGDSFSHIYFDAGDGYGDWRLDTFKLSCPHNKLEISWNTEGNFPLSYQEVFVKIHGARVVKGQQNGNDIPVINNLLKTQIFQHLSLSFE
jgi:alpha-glucosidase